MNLLRTLSAITGMTMVSRVTGLLRDSIFASTFGADALTDAFNVAFRIPNLLRRLFAEGAFSQAFVPILSESKTKQGDEVTRRLIDHVATVLVWSTIAVSVLGILASPVLIYLIGSGLKAFDTAVLMTRLMFPYIACMSFVALAGGVLNTWRQFKIPAVTPVLLNLSFIGAALFVSPFLAQPIYGMVIGVMVGGLAQVAVQIPSLIKIGMLPRISFNFREALRDEWVRRILSKMGPAVFAVAAAQISLLINTSIAASLREGSVSALTYADRLMEFPTAMLGVALGTILLPSLSKANNEGDAAEYSSLLNWGLRLTFMLALPAAVGLAILAEPMVAALFNYGAFHADDVHYSAQALVAYAVGLLGLILVKTLAPAFYARQEVRTPVKIAVWVLVATQVMNLVFVPLLGVAGLALSISVGACINAGCLYLGLRRRGIFVPQAGWWPFFTKLLVAVAALGGVCYGAASRVDWPGMQAHPVMRIALLLGIIGAGAVAYFAVLFAMGFRPADFKRISK
jgi:putative peptidoglycan lipid II flippase